MIDIARISEEVVFQLEGNGGGYSFSTSSDLPSKLPQGAQFYQKIKSIVLAKSPDFIYQEIDIMPLRKAFKVNSRKHLIRRLPDDFKVSTHKDFVFLKYSNEMLPYEIFEITKKYGMACYWDCETLVFCAINKYQFIIENIYRLFKSHRVRIELDPRHPELKTDNRDLWIWKM